MINGQQTGSGAPSPPLDAEIPRLIERALDHLLHRSHVALPGEVPKLVAEVSATFGGQDAVIYLADLQQRVLVPYLRRGGHNHENSPHVLGIDSTVAGRAFQQMRQLTQTARPVQPAGESVHIWLPLLDGTERVGVLGFVLPASVLDATVRRRLQRFASVVAELVVTKSLYGDSIVVTRRTSPMTLAAEIQWSVLPPLSFASESVTIVGGQEPAYEVAGDCLDYAVDEGVARFAVFDGMRHGIVSAQLISLAVAAYRNARRSGQSLTESAVHIESAVHEVFRLESFATALLCELDTTRGLLTWISAGHHEPLLLRGGQLVRALPVDPLLPLGLNHGLSETFVATVGTEQLQAGDRLLLYTDGVTEARSPEGEQFGRDRFVDLVTRHLAADLPAPLRPCAGWCRNCSTTKPATSRTTPPSSWSSGTVPRCPSLARVPLPHRAPRTSPGMKPRALMPATTSRQGSNRPWRRRTARRETFAVPVPFLELNPRLGDRLGPRAQLTM